MKWLPLLMAASVLTACGDGAVTPPAPVAALGPYAPERARTSGLPTVVVRPDARPNANGAVVNNLADALDRVAPGGTIRVHTGTYVGSIVIEKPLTLVGQGPDLPTLDAAGAGEAVLIQGPGIDVTIRGVRVVGAAFNGIEAREYGDVVIEDSEFFPTSDNFLSAGVGAFGGPGHSIVVRDSRFVGGEVGAHFFQTGNVTIEDNRFEGHAEDAFRYIESDGRAEGNEIVGCGGTCFTVLSNPNPVEILDNDISVGISDPVGVAFVADGGGAGGSLAVRGNRIVGSGGARDPNDPGTWPIGTAFFANNSFDALTVQGNSVEGGFTGIFIEVGSPNPGATLEFTDNVFSGPARSVVDAFGNGGTLVDIEVHSNDFTGFTTAISGGPASFDTGDATCNWWGAASGPPPGSVTPGIPADVYVPFATSSVAGTGATSCSGTS